MQFVVDHDYNRMRVVYYAEPKDLAAVPKSMPDFESLGAEWVTAEEVLSKKLKVRGMEPYLWIKYLEVEGGPIHPLAVLGSREK